ncbi:metal/formaldehyde-sensitive transcriptional repressor [Acinetobacter nectaris]|uniref:metal/formaldehyde-sensitive transcriptional repressor n=1 Tax=Acinetobacter nectaris TaxID=1219382 RepID=UPI001F162676|nr:metal/formaldehyde-sensitive transcriptional repressor [Acinetobacter nectaris]MCF8999659.1 metal/formaldehyde-sensitive transcriptional repressor [Acinetobacter nectaris]MCF9028306.1 metal/formaldehyde-sensitive transcriptional repressor [Acinetobacter nectaris]
MPKQIEDQKKILLRVRKISGQVQAIERALIEQKNCDAILQQICAARGAMNGLIHELLEVHLKDTLVVNQSSEQERSEELQNISKILKSYLK